MCGVVNKRKIPYGVINWAEIVRECLFVDNTRYIRELEAIKTPVFLRPKRFGKSVVCSMLAHYYDVGLKDRFDELFGMTDIGRDPTPLRNSFLVLQFDFSTVQVGTLAEIEKRFWQNIKGAVGYLTVKYKDLADWSAVESATAPAECIDKVRDVIRNNNLPPLYVIIDEYDNFTNELVVSNRDTEYNAICGHDSRGDATRESFFKAFFKSFKAGLADGTVGRTYFTGVTPTSSASSDSRRRRLMRMLTTSLPSTASTPHSSRRCWPTSRRSTTATIFFPARSRFTTRRSATGICGALSWSGSSRCS